MKKKFLLLLSLIMTVSIFVGIATVSSSAATESDTFAYVTTVNINNSAMDYDLSSSNTQIATKSSDGTYKLKNLKKNDTVIFKIITTQAIETPIYGIQYTAYISGMTPVGPVLTDGVKGFKTKASQNAGNDPELVCPKWKENNFDGYLLQFVWMDTNKKYAESIPSQMEVSYKFTVNDASNVKIKVDTSLVLPAGNNSSVEKIKEGQKYSTPVEYVIALGPIINGTITSTVDGVTKSDDTRVVSEGKKLIYTITPNKGYRISKLYVDENEYTPEQMSIKDGESYEHYFDMIMKSHYVTADCEYLGYSITASASAGGKIVYVDGSGTELQTINERLEGTINVAKGSAAKFKIVPKSGYKIKSVVVKKGTTEKSNSTDSEYTFPAGTDGFDNSITVKFELDGNNPPSTTTYQIHASAGANGTISPSGNIEVEEGSSKTFTFSPNTNKIVDYIIVNGQTIDGSNITNNSYTFSSVDKESSIIVYFTDAKYYVTASAGSNGTITPSGESEYDCKTEHSYLIQANSGYKISSVTITNLTNNTVNQINSDNFTGTSFTYPFSKKSIGRYKIEATFAANSSGNGNGGGGGGGGGGGSDKGDDSSKDDGSNKDDGSTVDVSKHGNFKICPRDATCPLEPFYDLDNNGWYHDGVHYCIEKGLMNGIGDGLFSPNGTTTRAMIVTILYRLEGSPYISESSGFEDVKNGTWYADSVAWAKKYGVVNGYSNTVFGPNDYITREQLAAILYRYSQYKKYDTSASNNLSSYVDRGQVSDWAVDAIKWANGAGIISGRTATTLVPRETATRAEAATMLQRYCVGIVK